MKINYKKENKKITHKLIIYFTDEEYENILSDLNYYFKTENSHYYTMNFISTLKRMIEERKLEDNHE